MPTSAIIVDNFLPYPNLVRKFALDQKFYTPEELAKETGKPQTWPGVRTKNVNEIDPQYADVVLSQILAIANQHFGIGHDVEVRSSFQLTREADGDSWIHLDDDMHLACLIYLTPDAPIDSGTILYTRPPHEVQDVIGNVYNRLAMYRSDIYHKSAKYFGSTLEDGRLTQVTFLRKVS